MPQYKIKSLKFEEKNKSNKKLNIYSPPRKKLEDVIYRKQKLAQKSIKKIVSFFFFWYVSFFYKRIEKHLDKQIGPNQTYKLLYSKENKMKRQCMDWEKYLQIMQLKRA